MLIQAGSDKPAALIGSGGSGMLLYLQREKWYIGEPEKFMISGGVLMKNLFFAGVLGSVLLIGAASGQAASWIKNDVDIPNKNVEANYYDGDSVKAHARSLTWTEKFVLTDFGAANYTKHLSQFPDCKSNIDKKGPVTQHQLDFQIKGGKFRLTAKRNFNKKNELICTDKEMGNDLDKAWHEIESGTPMYTRYYNLSTKYKIGDL
jgi:hypothetical protein